MRIAKVVGNVVSTIKIPAHHGHKLALIEYQTLDGKPEGARQIAMDVTDAGVGDLVLVSIDGGAGIMLTGGDKNLPIDAVICGVLDEYTVSC